jgi:hypothetical protein
VTEQPTTEQPYTEADVRLAIAALVAVNNGQGLIISDRPGEIADHEAHAVLDALAAAGRLLPEGASDDELIDLGNGDEPPPSAATIASVMAVVDAPYRPGTDFVLIEDDPHRVMVDVVEDAPDGLTHTYWSTHCRHGNHEACSAPVLYGETSYRTLDGNMMVRHGSSVERQPAQCKTCASPCICPCHTPVPINEESTDGR